ncbi:MAG: hypothetical protein ACK51T_00665 [bacterium]
MSKRKARLSGPLIPEWIRLPLDGMRVALAVPCTFYFVFGFIPLLLPRMPGGPFDFATPLSWLVMLALPVVAGVVVYLACRRVVRLRLRAAVAARFLACTHCGHSLIKIAPLLVCPECGRPASRTHSRERWINAARWFWGRPRKGGRSVD